MVAYYNGGILQWWHITMVARLQWWHITMVAYYNGGILQWWHIFNDYNGGMITMVAYYNGGMITMVVRLQQHNYSRH